MKEDAMKEKDRVMRSLLAWDRTAAISVVVVVFAWARDRRSRLGSIVSRSGRVQGGLGRKQAPPAEWLSDQLEAMGDAPQAMLAAGEGISDVARLRMGRELVLRVEAVDLSAL